MGNSAMGRPSKYRYALEGIDLSESAVWHVIDDNQKTRNAPSAMRKRYPGFDFKATQMSNGMFRLEARKM